MLSGISIWQLLIILVIVVLLFGTRRLRNLGSDLGSALKSFRSAVSEGDAGDDKKSSATLESSADKTSTKAAPKRKAATGAKRKTTGSTRGGSSKS